MEGQINMERKMMSKSKSVGSKHEGQHGPLSKVLLGIVLVASVVVLPGCGVVSLAGSVAGAAVDVTGAVVSTGVKATGALFVAGQ